MRSFKRRYNFDKPINKNIYSAISESCLTSIKTIDIIVSNSDMFNVNNYRLIELTGLAKFEFKKVETKFEDMFKNIIGGFSIGDI